MGRFALGFVNSLLYIRSDRRNISRGIKGNERKGKETIMENFTPVSGLIGGLLDKRRKFLEAVYDPRLIDEGLSLAG